MRLVWINSHSIRSITSNQLIGIATTRPSSSGASEQYGAAEMDARVLGSSASSLALLVPRSLARWLAWCGIDLASNHHSGSGCVPVCLSVRLRTSVCLPRSPDEKRRVVSAPNDDHSRSSDSEHISRATFAGKPNVSSYNYVGQHTSVRVRPLRVKSHCL